MSTEMCPDTMHDINLSTWSWVATGSETGTNFDRLPGQDGFLGNG